MTLPIYVINLDRRPERWLSISTNLNQIGLNAQRISAIDARSMALKGRTSKTIPLGMSVGEKACLLSHYKTLKEFLSSSHPAALVLEDDAEVANDVIGCLQSTDWWVGTAGLLQLSTYSERLRLVGPSISQTPCGRQIRPILGSGGPGAGYLIDRKTAQIVLNAVNACAVPPMPIDVLLFYMGWSSLARRLKPVLIDPAIVRQKYEVFGSDITPSKDRESWMFNRKKMKSWDRRIFKIRIEGLKLVGKANRLCIHYSDVHNPV